MSFGVLKQKKEWDLHPFQWGIEDLAPGETIYRAPFEIFEQLLKVPLLNSDGVLINRAGDKKKQLRDAYKSLGTNLKHFSCRNPFSPLQPRGEFLLVHVQVKFLLSP